MIEYMRSYLQKSAGIELKGTNVEGVYTFSKNNMYYMVEYNPVKDSNYFRIILPNLYDINDQNSNEMHKAINNTNIQYKVVKFTETSGKVWAAVESFFYSNDGLESLIARLIASLDGGANFFAGQLTNQ